MNRKRVFAVLGTAAVVVGVGGVLPMSAAPVASADPLPNGYDVSCQGNGGNTICHISGCPRVHDEYAGDVVHIRINGVGDAEVGKACGDTLNYTVGIPGDTGFTLAMQGCRKKDLEKDWCGPFSDFVYTPPPKVQPPIQCPPGSVSPTVPAGQQCQAKPVEAAQPVQCPPGSPVPSVPAGQTCPAAEQAPTNAVTLDFARSGLQLKANFKNSSKVPAQCHYDAEAAGGTAIGGKTDDFGLGANATVTRTYTGPPIASTYHVVVSCTGSFNGQNVEIGHIDQNFDF